MDEIDDIARENREAWAGKRIWVIVEETDGYSVHAHSSEGVAPSSDYPNKREAASRLLQLLHIGPVRPQTEPEIACIGEIDHD